MEKQLNLVTGILSSRLDAIEAILINKGICTKEEAEKMFMEKFELNAERIKAKLTAEALEDKE